MCVHVRACMCMWVCACVCVHEWVCMYLLGVGRGGNEGKKGRIEKKRRKAEKHSEEED